MRTNLYKFTFGLLAILISGAAFAQYAMLYVGKSDNALDVSTKDYFTLEGYNVTLVEEDDFKVADGTYSTADGYAGFDVLFVSESIGSTSANNYMTAGFPIPCIATEGFVAKNSRWGLLADDSETYFKQLSSADITADILTMVIIDNEHWITKEYDQNYNLVWASIDDPTKMGVTGFKLDEDIDGARPLAQFLFDMGGLSSLWAIPKGSMLHNDIELPNMVIIGIIQSDVGQTFMDDFYLLLGRCVRWVTDDYTIESANAPRNYNLIAGPNPTTGMVNLSMNLLEAGDVRINIYDITGKLMKSINSGYLNAGYNTIPLDFSDLPQAQYLYEVVTRSSILKGKIIKE